MTEIKNIKFKELIKNLDLRHPITEIAELMHSAKSAVSIVYNDKKEASPKFIEQLEKAIRKKEQIEQKKQNVPHETPYHKNRLLLKNNSFIRFEDLAGDGIFKPIPFYNINVSAGDVIFLDDGTIDGRDPDDYMFIPKYVDADIAFPTYGHSMYPEISNGDKVAYKFLKDWSFFNYGMKYLIVTNEQRLVKYIKRHDKKDYLLLESRNPDYQPIDMPISSIRYILQVRYIGKTEM